MQSLEYKQVLINDRLLFYVETDDELRSENGSSFTYSPSSVSNYGDYLLNSGAESSSTCRPSSESNYGDYLLHSETESSSTYRPNSESDSESLGSEAERSFSYTPSSESCSSVEETCESLSWLWDPF